MCNLQNIGSGKCDLQQLVSMVYGFGLSPFPGFPHEQTMSQVEENHFRKALAFYNYNWTDPLSFARYGRNFKVHRPDQMTQEQAEDGLNAIYTGYLAICHEVLSGLGVFIETPPF